jgi:hypothetical protein
MALVEIRPIPKDNVWHGVKDADKNFDQEKTYEVFYNSNTGKYDLNMTSEQKEKFEKLLGVEITEVFDYQKPHPLFSTRPYQLRLPNRTIFLNTGIPMEAFKVQWAKSPNFGFVANSFREWENGDYPNATHIIYDEGDEIATKASKAQLRMNVLRVASKLTAEEKVAIIRIVTDENVKTQSNDYVTVAIDDIANDQRKAEQFIEVAEKKKSTLLIEGTIFKALDKNVLIKQKGMITFLGEPIGTTTDEVVLWFADPQNSELKKALLEKLNS